MYPATPKAVKTAVAGLKKEVSAIEQNQPRQTFEKTVAVAGFALFVITSYSIHYTKLYEAKCR